MNGDRDGLALPVTAGARVALVVSHPAHELLVHGWMAAARPLVHVLTDGSGRAGRPRLDHTTRVLAETGATPGEIYGRLPDRALYDVILRGEHGAFTNLARELARTFLRDGITLTDVESGRAVFECEPSESHFNPIGTVHGGVISTLLDSALSCAVHTTLPAGTGYTTAELKVNFVRLVVIGTGRLRAEGRGIHAGSRLATAEARLTDAAGKLYAHAVGTCLVVGAR